MHPTTDQPTPQPPLAPPPFPHVHVPAAPPLTPAPAAAVGTRGRIAAIGLVVSACLVLIGLVARSWFTVSHDAGIVGLRGVESCFGGHCEARSWFDLKRSLPEVELFIVLALAGGAASVGLLLHAAAMLVAGTPRRTLLVLLQVTLAVGLFGAIAFVLRLSIGDMSRDLSLSWAGFLVVGGLVAASTILTTWVRPLMKQR